MIGSKRFFDRNIEQSVFERCAAAFAAEGTGAATPASRGDRCISKISICRLTRVEGQRIRAWKVRIVSRAARM